MEKESNSLRFSDLAGILEQALSSPEIMGAIASLLSMLKSTNAPQESTPATSVPTSETQGEESAVMALPSPPKKASASHQKREMLSAIRPYMSERRCQMIDRMTHAADLVQLLSRR